MLPARQTKGFELLRYPRRLLDEYNVSKLAVDNMQLLAKIRDAIPFVAVHNYRGISREPLAPWSSEDENIIRASPGVPADLERELPARKRFLELNGEDRTRWDHYHGGCDYDKELLSSLNGAKEVFRCLNAPDEYEVVEVSREPCSTDFQFLGFDIGYWGGDHFSIICDSVVMPRWHPPNPDDLPELAERLRNLNQQILFPTIEEAVQFMEYYMSRPWAERESFPGEFCIIKIAVP